MVAHAGENTYFAQRVRRRRGEVIGEETSEHSASGFQLGYLTLPRCGAAEAAHRTLCTLVKENFYSLLVLRQDAQGKRGSDDNKRGKVERISRGIYTGEEKGG